MAIDESDQADSGQFEGGDESAAVAGRPGADGLDPSVQVGRYTWADFLDEHGHGDAVDVLYPDGRPQPEAQSLGLDSRDDAASPPRGDDWDRVEFDPQRYLGYHPDEIEDLIRDYAAPEAKRLHRIFQDHIDAGGQVSKGIYTWEQFKQEYYYDQQGNPPRENGQIVPFKPEEYLGFHPENTEEVFGEFGDVGKELAQLVDDRTVDVSPELDEDEFFSTEDGHTTLVNRYDLEKAVPFQKKLHFQEEDRYWVNKPYAFVIIFHSRKENEKKYYLVEPYLNEIEHDLKEFLTGKLRTAIKYADDEVVTVEGEEQRKDVIEQETKKLLKRYDLFKKRSSSGGQQGFLQNLVEMFDQDESVEEDDDLLQGLDGISVRPEPVVLAEDPDMLSEYQVEKLLYLLKRDFIGYERIDGIKHDINVEDISCDGYNSPVFVYHSDYEQIISNVYHGEEELDDFVVKLAQRSGKGISKRRPQVDATLPDGSRAQLTLGREVSDHGTNYTIRQFKDVPFTPVDLINWNTFSLEEMAFLWLCIENHKSLIFAGGTASGKTTSLNAVSLFIPSNTKIVSIEDTREVELPQRNWVASVTRPSFSDDDQGDVDEFDLLEAALRQRPDYIVMGEIRGEEGRTLFQVMSTGHTTYTTFHADTVGEVLKRFTTDPINVSKTMFTALDLVSIQTQTRVQGRKVRRNKKLTEVNHYDADTDEINVQDVYQWQAETDEFLKMGDSNTLEEIKFDRGWTEDRLQNELFKREVILAYLVKNGINEYTKVAATIQAFINDPDTILTLIANGQLERSLGDLREMESVQIQVDPEKEELVPRPDPAEEGYNLAMDILEQAETALFDDYRGQGVSGIENALGGMDDVDESFRADEASTDDFDFGGSPDENLDDEFDFDDDGFTVDPDEDPFDDGPDWLDDDDGGWEDELEQPALEDGEASDSGEETPALAEAGASAQQDAVTEQSTPDDGRSELEDGDVEEQVPELEAGATEDDESVAAASADSVSFGDTDSSLDDSGVEEEGADDEDMSALPDAEQEQADTQGAPDTPQEQTEDSVETGQEPELESEPEPEREPEPEPNEEIDHGSEDTSPFSESDEESDPFEQEPDDSSSPFEESTDSTEEDDDGGLLGGDTDSSGGGSLFDDDSDSDDTGSPFGDSDDGDSLLGGDTDSSDTGSLFDDDSDDGGSIFDDDSDDGGSIFDDDSDDDDSGLFDDDDSDDGSPFDDDSDLFGSDDDEEEEDSDGISGFEDVDFDFDS
jgi:flagellar protein FlaI